MKIGDILYLIAMVGFAWITFGIVRGNFQRKFDEYGNRLDLNDGRFSDNGCDDNSQI
jgi:hypothetical protein